MEKRPLKGIRADLNYSQEEMAQKLGITRQAYAQKEKGKTPLLACELIIISEVSKIPMEQIEVLR